MKKLLILLTLLFSVTTLFTACSSKKPTKIVQEQRHIDTQKIQNAYNELDNEINKNK